MQVKNMLDENVRMEVARDSSTPITALWELSVDESQHVRGEVALNEKAPADMLMRLSEDESEIVRMGVAGNPVAPIDILNKLIESDASEHIRREAKLTKEGKNGI